MTGYTLWKDFHIDFWLKLSFFALFFVGLPVLSTSQLSSILLGMRQFDFRLFYNFIIELPESFLNFLPLLILGIITIAFFYLALKSIFIFPLWKSLEERKLKLWSNRKMDIIKGLNLLSYLVIIIIIVLMSVITLTLVAIFLVPLIFPNILFRMKGSIFPYSVLAFLSSYLLILSFITSIVFDLQVPYIHFQNMMIIPSLKKVLSIIKNNFSSFLYYYIVRILLLLGFLSIWGIISYHLVFPLINKVNWARIFHFDLQGFTLAKALVFLIMLSGLLFIIRYLFALIFLPIVVFFRYYGLSFLAKFDEQFEWLFTDYYKESYRNYFAKHYQEIKIE